MTTPPPYSPSDGEYPTYAKPPTTPKRSKKPWILGAIGVVIVLIVIAAVSGGGGDKDSTTTAASSTAAAPSTVTVTAAPTTTTQAPAPAAQAPVAPETSTAAAAAPERATVMPAVVCMNLQAAQDLIQENGVFFSRSDDASGQGRRQILDRNWIVVAQTPAPGESVGEAEAVLSVVKDDEPNDC